MMDSREIEIFNLEAELDKWRDLAIKERNDKIQLRDKLEAEIYDLNRELGTLTTSIALSNKTYGDTIAVFKAENKALREKYQELIMEAESPFSGETRHETALRYIKSCEKGSNQTAKQGGE